MFAKKTLTTALSAVALLATTAFSVTTALAGTGMVEDNSKDKKAVIEQKPREPKFYFSLGIGTDVDYRATPFSENAIGAANLPASSAFSGGVDRVGTLRLNRRRYDAIFPYDWDNGPYRIQGEFGYVASRYGEIFGMLKYTHMGSDNTSIGTATFGDIVNTDADGNVTGVLRGFRVPVRADFDDYDSIGAELGFRLFFLPKEARLRPYISFAAGATVLINDIDARFYLPDGTTLFDGGFYQSGVVATGSILAGVEFALTKNFSLGADAGGRYEFPLQQRDRDLDRIGIGGGTGTTNNTNLNGANNAGDRFYLPFTFYGKVRF